MLNIRLLVKACIAVSLLQASFGQAEEVGSFEKVSFYFAAHQDDWQLFMNPSAFRDVADAGTKTVFVHLTAGDAGSGTGTRGRKHPFYLARENGAEAAVRFMADADKFPAEKVVSHMQFNGHPIYRVSYRNTVSYFLRVPDGNGSGSGYPETGHQSLARLSSGEAAILSAIDGSTVYRGWADLTATLRALVNQERGNAPSVQLNVGETDATINPGDHSDHQMTAKAALEATGQLACARRLHYVDYASARLPANLSAADRDMESAVFAVTTAGIRAFDHANAWHYYDNLYVGRNYFRVEEGTGRCDALPEVATAPQNPADRQLHAEAKAAEAQPRVAQ